MTAHASTLRRWSDIPDRRGAPWPGRDDKIVILFSGSARGTYITAAAARRIAVGLTGLFLLSPATRFGYLIYPVALSWWAVPADRKQENWRNRPVAVPDRTRAGVR